MIGATWTRRRGSPRDLQRGDPVRRVLLIMLLVLATPAGAQEKTWRLGFLTPGGASSDAPGSIRGTTLPLLAEQGFVEGRNLVFVPATAEGDPARLPHLADMLAQQQVDVIIAVGNLAARAALRAAPG